MGAWGSSLQHGGRSSVLPLQQRVGQWMPFLALGSVTYAMTWTHLSGRGNINAPSDIGSQGFMSAPITALHWLMLDPRCPKEMNPMEAECVYLKYISSSAQNLISICRCLGVCTLYLSLSIYIYVHTRVFMSQYNILKAELWWNPGSPHLIQILSVFGMFSTQHKISGQYRVPLWIYQMS